METVSVSAAQVAKWQEMERKAKLSARRATIKNLILVEKAKAHGLTVTKAEIDARIASEDARKVAEAATPAEA